MNVPGYYFDPEKKRYFKVEGSHTAPSGSAWSTDNIKKRKLENQKAEVVSRRLALNKARIKRSRALNDPLTGGFIAREYGLLHHDVVSSVLAAGLVGKGSMPFIDARWSASQNMTSMCIVGEDPWTDLSFGYFSPDGTAIASTYIPRDRSGRVHRRLLAEYSTPENRISPYHVGTMDQISSLAFHRRRGVLLIAQSAPKDQASIKAVVPSQLPDANRHHMTPRFRMGEEPDMTRTIRAKPRRPPDSFDAESASEYTHLNNTTVMRSNVGFDSGYFEINVVAAGPDWSDDIICAAGSNRGILQWKGEHYVSLNGSLKWTAPTVTNRLTIDNPFHDIFAVDFRRNHESIIFGGGRPGRCFVADSRTCDVEWLSFSHGSSIAHIKSLNDHQVLVSGTRNLMKIYDVRMVKGHTRIVSKYVCQSVGVDPDRSIVSFPEYKNDAYNKLGFSVDLEAGLVATAHDDGKVALHSLKSGHQLKSPAVDAIQADVQNRGPVKALQFEKLSGDSHKSLFAAVGNNLELYSLGVTDHSNEA